MSPEINSPELQDAVGKISNIAEFSRLHHVSRQVIYDVREGKEIKPSTFRKLVVGLAEEGLWAQPIATPETLRGGSKMSGLTDSPDSQQIRAALIDRSPKISSIGLPTAENHYVEIDAAELEAMNARKHKSPIELAYESRAALNEILKKKTLPENTRRHLFSALRLVELGIEEYNRAIS